MEQGEVSFINRTHHNQRTQVCIKWDDNLTVVGAITPYRDGDDGQTLSYVFQPLAARGPFFYRIHEYDPEDGSDNPEPARTHFAVINELRINASDSEQESGISRESVRQTIEGFLANVVRTNLTGVIGSDD